MIGDGIIESKRLVPCITDDELKSEYKDQKDFILYCNYPDNFIKMIKCEDDNHNDVNYELLDAEIKIITNEIKPVTIFYEVTHSYIFDQLKAICKC